MMMNDEQIERLAEGLGAERRKHSEPLQAAFTRLMRATRELSQASYEYDVQLRIMARNAKASESGLE